MDVHGQTQAGSTRQDNQDQFVIAQLNKSLLLRQASTSLHDTRLIGETQAHLFVVADGSSQNGDGARASTIAIDSIVRYVLDSLPWMLARDAPSAGFRRTRDERRLIAELRRAVRRAEGNVLKLAGDAEAATTMTMAYLLWPRLFVLHAGNTRCYLRRGGRLRRVTIDRGTEARRPVDEVAPLWDEPSPGSTPGISACTVELQIDDTLLLCTDGLTRAIDDDRIATTISIGSSAADTCRLLVAAATDAGADDDVTVIVAQFRAVAEDPAGIGGGEVDDDYEKARPPASPETPSASPAAGPEPASGA